jgi:hypothetical protein
MAASSGSENEVWERSEYPRHHYFRGVQVQKGFQKSHIFQFYRQKGLDQAIISGTDKGHENNF